MSNAQIEKISGIALRANEEQAQERALAESTEDSALLPGVAPSVGDTGLISALAMSLSALADLRESDLARYKQVREQIPKDLRTEIESALSHNMNHSAENAALDDAARIILAALSAAGIKVTDS